MFKCRFLLIELIILSFSFIFSQTLQDLEKLKKAAEKRINSNQNTEIENQAPAKNDIFDAQIIKYNALESNVGKDTTGLKFFGYDFFTKRDTVKFWENLPIPSEYLIGPGDELIISIWGQTQIRKNYVVSREGKIYDEKVGIIFVSGKSINELKNYLNQEFGKIYSTLRGVNPTSYIDVSLGQLRSINVNFVGEVSYPGVYPLHPFSNLLMGLIQIGGIKETGSIRSISIKRNNETVANFDLYKYLLSGDIPNKIQLRDQDIVVVPVRKSTIFVDSSVVRPAIYESLPNETIKDLINYSGGLTTTASNIISLERVKNRNEIEKNNPNSKSFYINYLDSENYQAIDGDKIKVKSIFKSVQKVEIFGQVKKEGQYNYYDKMTLTDLIELSGGFKDSTYLKSVYLEQAEIIRRDPATRYEKIIKINLKDFIENDKSKNIPLKNLDKVIIHSNLNFFERKNVKITGEVNVPGQYPIVRDGEDLSSLINRAGGLTSKALVNGISIFRDSEVVLSDNIDKNIFVSKIRKQRVAWEDKKIILMPNDSIVVKESTQTITISGEVYNPGIISYKKGKNLNYYINAAGGLTNNGDMNKIIVVHANGLVSPKRRFINPKIDDGAQIIVNEKELQEPFNLTQFATNWTSIISSMLTVVILSQQLSN